MAFLSDVLQLGVSSATGYVGVLPANGTYNGTATDNVEITVNFRAGTNDALSINGAVAYSSASTQSAASIKFFQGKGSTWSVSSNSASLNGSISQRKVD